MFPYIAENMIKTIFLSGLIILISFLGGSQPVFARNQAIIADHTSISKFSQLTTSQTQQVKTLLRLSYGHTSHGSQIISGMTKLHEDNGNLDFNTNGAIQSNVLSIADSTPTGDLGNPDRTTWAAKTRAYLNGTGSNRNVVIWSWCGQVTLSTAADIDTYLNLMNQLESEFPNVTFVYMTGHLDGGGTNGNLYQRNNQIRNYVNNNHKVLFDFADIESYNPDGTFYPNESDACNWCSSWCSSHSCSSCGGSCAHSHCFNCYQKGKAFWWLLAQIAQEKSGVSPSPSLSPTITPVPINPPTSTPRPSSTLTPTPVVSCPSGDLGNLNCDNLRLINESDLNILLSKWSPQGPVPTALSGQRSADLYNDGKINEQDLNFIFTNWKTN